MGHLSHPPLIYHLGAPPGFKWAIAEFQQEYNFQLSSSEKLPLTGEGSASPDFSSDVYIPSANKNPPQRGQTSDSDHISDLRQGYLQLTDVAGLTLPKSSFQVLHLHGLKALYHWASLSGGIVHAMQQARQRGIKVIFHEWPDLERIYALKDSSTSELFASLKQVRFHRHLITGIPDLSKGINQHDVGTSLTKILPVSSGKEYIVMPLHPVMSKQTTANSSSTEPGSNRLSILYLPYFAGSEKDIGIRKILAAFAEKYADWTSIKIIESESLIPEKSDKSTVRRFVELADGDLVIEEFRSQSYGPNAALAMVYGLPVIATNNEVSAETWPALKTCPVLHATPDTLEKKLAMILSEPRCLKDLSIRCREFANSHHSARNISAKLASIYHAPLDDGRERDNSPVYRSESPKK